MAGYILRTLGLTKRYKKHIVLDQVSIQVRTGDIYGLIGMNGAGKTTLIRLLAGLIEPDDGSMELLGECHDHKLESLRHQVGWLIETPSFYSHLTAYENLEIERLHKGIQDPDDIRHALRIVGLNQTGSKKTKDFSYGMKQRLGIAMALIGKPKLLVLDEPTNGLDPVGIIEMRNLLKALKSEHGISIVVSSHLLSELSQVADCYGIIHDGRLLNEISVEELNSRHGHPDLERYYLDLIEGSRRHVQFA